jgi:hypothetical protein
MYSVDVDLKPFVPQEENAKNATPEAILAVSFAEYMASESRRTHELERPIQSLARSEARD